jgi:hypothetical protein
MNADQECVFRFVGDVGDSGDSRAAFQDRDAVRPSFSGLRFSQEIQTGNSTGE